MMLDNCCRVLSWLRPQVDTKSLVLIGGTAGVVLMWRHRQRVKGYLIAGPYPSGCALVPLRALQRAVIDCTKKDVSQDWFPLDHKLRAPHVRNTDNGHPVSGAARDCARETIVAAIDALGATKFEISPGGHTLDEQRCQHQHYAVGDLHRSVSADTPKNGDVIACIDVDYYLENPDKTFGYVNPIILHTFQPFSVCGMDGDSPYRIIDDTIVYDVSGGASWRHKLWDWTVFGEFVSFPAQELGVFGQLLSWFGVRKNIYQKIHHARPYEDCPHRAMVWMLPQFTAWSISWLPTDLRARRLSRIQFADATRPGWNTITSIRNNEVWISFGRAGEDACMDMKKTNFDVLMGLQSAQSVTSRMLGMGYNSPHDLALVGQYFRKAIVEPVSSVRLAKPATVKVHWPASFEAETEESSARSYAAPLVTDENLMPMIKRWECLSDSLERRVTFVRNTVEPPRRYNSLAEEFVRLVVPHPDLGHPMSLEEAAGELSKPSQVLAVTNIWETVDMSHRRLIEAFVKNEPTMKNGRIISSFPDARFLLKFSAFTLKFREEVLHTEWNQHWFCPGSTPYEIAKRVQEYVGDVHRPAEGDFSNLDGSISLWLQRRVMNAVYHRYFHPDHRKELTNYTDMMVNCPARAKRFGFRYDAGVGVKSGSPTTCDLNTVANAFVMYCAVRRSFPELAPCDAFRHIGLAFGDDGLFDATFASQWNKVAKDLGLTLKVESYKPDKGVTFLARVFPDPWRSLTSFQDPIRTWRKLHLTSRDPTVPVADAAVDRLEGYLTTDKLTPITSEYADSLVRYYLPKTSADRSRRKDRNREVPYWLTQGGAWPQDPADEALMEDCIAARTQLPVEDVRAWRSRLRDIRDPWTIPRLDRTEDDVPYVNTIDAEGTPSEDRVDQRQLERDQHVHRSRASVGIANTSGPVDSGGSPISNRGARPQNQLRHRRVSIIPQLDGRETTAFNRQLHEQTEAGGGTSGDGRRPRQTDVRVKQRRRAGVRHRPKAQPARQGQRAITAGARSS
uniref:RNA-directed RNA polymerase n=1 Tax=Satepeofons virus TaxID=3072219 RepID=A0AA96NL46_9VIRU|nr:MAG: RNA-dependent RNA polymerase [Satepeofons virus]